MRLQKPLFIFLFLVQGSTAFTQNDSSTKASQIIRIEQALADGLPGDSTLWRRYLDPHWHLVDEDGNGSFREEFLAGFKKWPVGVSGKVAVTKPVFIFHGDVAIVHYTAEEEENYFGQVLHTRYGTADVWFRTDTSWMMLSMQDFEIPALPQAVKLNAAGIGPFAGKYQLTEDRTATVSVSHDSLFIQKAAGKPELLMPESDNIFFRKSDARGRKIFVKGPEGAMEMIERRNGQDVIWKRIRS